MKETTKEQGFDEEIELNMLINLLELEPKTLEESEYIKIWINYQIRTGELIIE